jgi:hypothetical protein
LEPERAPVLVDEVLDEDEAAAFGSCCESVVAQP